MTNDQNPYTNPNATPSDNDASLDGNSAKEVKKPPLVVYGFTFWVMGALMPKLIFAITRPTEFTPFVRGVGIGCGLVQVAGSAILIFCLFRFLYRSIANKKTH